MLTVTRVKIIQQPEHYPAIDENQWRLAFENHGHRPEHYLQSNRFSCVEDSYGRESEYRFVAHVANNVLHFRGYASPPEQRLKASHEAEITARFDDLAQHQEFMWELWGVDRDEPESASDQEPEEQPQYRPNQATMARDAMSTYDTLGETALLVHVCAARQTPSPVPAFATVNTEALSDGSTVELDRTQRPYRYRFTGREEDQPVSVTRPASEIPIAPAHTPAVPLVHWPTADHVTAMVIEQAMLRQNPDRRPLSATPSLMAAAETLAPSLRAAVNEHVLSQSQPQEVNDLMEAVVLQYAEEVSHKVSGAELDKLCRHVASQEVNNHDYRQ